MTSTVQRLVDAPLKIDAKAIIAALQKRHQWNGGNGWLFLTELRIGTGFGRDAEQRLDAWAMAMWPSRGHERVAYEIKVSRSDFLAELKNPAKRKRALLLSNLFYFAAPKGLIRADELPPEAGLMEVEDGTAWSTVPAPWRDTPPANWRFVAAIARLAMRAANK